MSGEQGLRSALKVCVGGKSREIAVWRLIDTGADFLITFDGRGKHFTFRLRTLFPIELTVEKHRSHGDDASGRTLRFEANEQEP